MPRPDHVIKELTAALSALSIQHHKLTDRVTKLENQGVEKKLDMLILCKVYDVEKKILRLLQGADDQKLAELSARLKASSTDQAAAVTDAGTPTSQAGE